MVAACRQVVEKTKRERLREERAEGGRERKKEKEERQGGGEGRKRINQSCQR